jgi:hypothetical protein
MGFKIIELGEEVIYKNVSIQIELSRLDKTCDQKTISACGDCRWDKRSSGRRYDSISGYSVMIGCQSQLVLDIEPMSNTCSKCTKNNPHTSELYPKIVDCSSKGMEAVGSTWIVNGLFSNYPVYIYYEYSWMKV